MAEILNLDDFRRRRDAPDADDDTPDYVPRRYLPPGWAYYNSADVVDVAERLAGMGLTEKQRGFVENMHSEALAAWQSGYNVALSRNQGLWLNGLLDKYSISAGGAGRDGA